MRRFVYSAVRMSAPVVNCCVAILFAALLPVSALAVDVTASDGAFTDRVQVSWTKDESAANYTVFRCTSDDVESCQDIGKFDNTQARELSDFGAQPLVIYQYRVTVCTFVFCNAISEADTGYRAGVEVDDFGDSCNEAAIVGENTSTIGSLESVGDKDYFRIDVSVAGQLLINTSGGTDTAGALKDANCQDIASSGSGGQGANFQLSGRLQAGTYFVEVSGEASATGGYQFNSQLTPDDDYGNSCNDARRLDANGQRSGTLEVGGDVDYFGIELLSAGTLTISSAGGTDTVGSLKDNNCSTLIEDNNSAGDVNFQISTQLPAGIYFLEVRGASGGVTGDYQVSTVFDAEDDHGNTCSEAAELGSNGSIGGVLEKAGDQDVFHIGINERGSLQVLTTGDTDTYGFLVNSNCEVIARDDDSGENVNFMINAELLPGDYYIVIQGYANAAVGAYQLTSGFVAATETGGSCANARPVDLGSRVLDEIEVEGDEDYFRIDLDTQGTLQLQSSGDTDMVGTLRNANCEVLAEDDDGGSNTNFRIAADLPAGTYYVSARGFGPTVGYYYFESKIIPPDEYGNNCDTATSVDPDSITDGVIGSEGDHDVFRFVLENDSLMFMQTDGATDTFSVLRNAECGFIRRNDDGGSGTNTRIATWLPAGVYYLDVYGYANVSTGPYQLLMSTVDDGLGVDLTLNLGLNDAWFNPETAGQGFFVTVFPETGLIFVSWFTHESFFPDGGVSNGLGDPGHRWYTALGTIYGDEAFLSLELTSGGRFNSADPVNQAYVGNLYVKFDSCSSGRIHYDLPDQEVSGWIPVQRAVVDGEAICENLGYYQGPWIVDQEGSPVTAANAGKPDPVEPDTVQESETQNEPLTVMNYGLNDAWYNPAWIGQGFFVTVFPDLGGVFVSWFTFDSTPPDAETPFNIGAPGHRWFTAFGFFDGNRADMELELTQYGIFNDPAPVQQGSRGNLSIEFSDCRNAKINYHIEQTGETGEIDIVRVLEDPFNMYECENPYEFGVPVQ